MAQARGFAVAVDPRRLAGTPTLWPPQHVGACHAAMPSGAQSRSALPCLLPRRARDPVARTCGSAVPSCVSTPLLLPPIAAQEEAAVARALHLSFAANCLLLVVRVGIAVISGSLSLVVATLDAVLMSSAQVCCGQLRRAVVSAHCITRSMGGSTAC